MFYRSFFFSLQHPHHHLLTFIFDVMWCDVMCISILIQCEMYWKRAWVCESGSTTSIRYCSLAPFIWVRCLIHHNVSYVEPNCNSHSYSTLDSKMNSAKTGSSLIFKSMQFVWFTSCHCIDVIQNNVLHGIVLLCQCILYEWIEMINHVTSMF